MLAITFQTKKDSLADKWASLLRNILCALFIEDPAGPKDYELLLFFADRRSKEFAKEAKRGVEIRSFTPTVFYDLLN